MKIAVRMDDITPDMDWDAFYRVKEILDRAGIRPLLGIVPDNRDPKLHRGEARPDFWEIMCALQAQGWCLALHGMHHLYTTQKGGMFPLNLQSEYAGLPLEEQSRMIRQGKEILEQKGIHTTLFMAPGHSYDRNTIKALRENGFTGVTDGLGGTPYRYKGLTFYPISFQMKKTLRKKKGYSTMVLHANTMTEKDFENLEKRIEMEHHNASLHYISYQEYLGVQATGRTIFGRILEWTMATLKRMLMQYHR